MDFSAFISRFIEIFWLYWAAAIEQLYSVSLYNIYHWVILWCVLCFVLELAFPRKLDYKVIGRKGFWQDLFYVFFNDFLFMGLGFFALMYVIGEAYTAGFASIGIANPVLFEIHHLPLWAQIVILFILVDLMEFLAHYAMHRFNFLWAFHKIHHAQEEIGFASSRHFHWGEFFIFKPFLFLPLGLIGYTAKEFTILQLTLVYFAAFFSHTNIKLNFGFLNYLLITPQTQLWHHAKNLPMRYGVNFASVLPLWDLLIGTFYLPKTDEKPELGVDDMDEMPRSFWGQFIYPFVFLFSKGKQKDNVFEASLTTVDTLPAPMQNKSVPKTKGKAAKKNQKKRKKQ